MAGSFVKMHIPITARLSEHQPGGPQGVLDNLLHT